MSDQQFNTLMHLTRDRLTKISNDLKNITNKSQWSETEVFLIEDLSIQIERVIELIVVLV